MPSQASLDLVQKMYIGYYSRPGDSGGLQYWADRVDQAGGSFTTELLSSFGSSAEYLSRMDGLSSEALMQNLYQALFNRQPDSGGLAWWTNELDSGNRTLVNVAIDFINGATGSDLTIINNKVSAANQFTNTVSSSGVIYGGSEIAGTVSWLASVGETTESLNTAVSGLPDLIHNFPKENSGNTDNTDNTDNQDKAKSDKEDNKLTLDDSDDKIGISATNYSSVQNSDASVLTNLDDFRADSRFANIDGSGHTVVVIDTAFDLDHSFLGPDADNNGVADRIVYHADFTNEGDGANTSDPSQNHGTHVATTIASSNSTHPGVAPGANIITLQVLGEQGGTAMWIQKALQWVVENATEFNVVAVNMSLGDSSNHTSNITSWASDELARLAELGVVTVAASGNDYEYLKQEGVGYPAADPNALSVGAVVSSGSSSDTLASFSQRSDTTTDVVAPGVNITAGNVGGGTVSMSGTSMAAPFISGTVALAQQIANQTLGRSLTVEEFNNVLKSSATTIRDSNNSSDGVPNTGDSFSRVDVLALGEAILALSGSNSGGGTPTPTPPTPPTPTPSTDIPNNTTTTATLAVGGSETGTLETTGDSDWFGISLTAGNSYTFSLNGITLTDPYLRLYNSSGTLIQFNDDANGSLNSELSFIPDSSGTYYLSAGSYLGNDTGTYSISASVSTVQDQEPGTGSGSGNTDQANGSIDYSGDTDRFSSYFEAGTTYTISLEGSSTNAGTLVDPILQLYGPDARLISSNDDGGVGLNSELVYTATSSGNYEVVASGYGSSVGTYTLNLTSTRSGDSVADNTSTTHSITEGGKVTGEIDFANDSDWYQVQLTAGTQYSITLNGKSTTLAALADPTVKLYDASGNFITSDDDGGIGLNSSLQYSATQSGTYYIAATGYGDGTGGYELTFQSNGSDVGNTVNTATSITAGTPVNSTIDFSNDSDWFAITLNAGTRYTIDLKGASSSDGTLSDPVLGLYDSTGSFLESNDDGGTALNSQLTYTAPTSGTYYISANAYGDTTGSYQLLVSGEAGTGQQTDLIAGNVSTTTSITTDIDVAGLIDFHGDDDWYQVQLIAGNDYNISLSGISSDKGTLFDPNLKIYDNNGQLITGDDDGGVGLDSSLTFSPTSTGNYFVSASAYADATYTATGTYTLAVNTVPQAHQITTVGVSSIDINPLSAEYL